MADSLSPAGTTQVLRPTRVRARIFALSFIAALLNYGDRIAISVAAPFILDEFHFSPLAWGVILSAFFWTYSPFALLGGIMADRIGIRRAYLIAMLVWSVSLPITASAWNFAAFMVARLLFGMGEGPQAPITTKLTASWFPRRQTATMLNSIQSGTTIGPIIATPFVVWVSLTLGWRESFFILAGLGLIWAAIWWRTARDTPAEHPKVNNSELEFITADHNTVTLTSTPAEDTEELSKHKTEFWRLLRSPYVIALAFAFFCYSWVLFMFLTWYPQYLVQGRGISKQDLASLATIPWITATIGLIGGGMLADRLIKRSGNLVKSRKWIAATGLLGAAVCFGPSPFVDSPTLGLILVSAATFFLLGSYQYQSLIVAVAPARYTGRMAGFIQMCSTIAGMLAPIVTGAIVDATGSFTPAFVVGGAFAILGACAVGIFVRQPKAAQVLTKTASKQA